MGQFFQPLPGLSMPWGVPKYFALKNLLKMMNHALFTYVRKDKFLLTFFIILLFLQHLEYNLNGSYFIT